MPENIWLVAAIWMSLAFVASLISIRTGISVALVEILVGGSGKLPRQSQDDRVDQFPRDARKRHAHIPGGGGDRSQIAEPQG